MNHNHVPSNGNFSPSQQEAEARYREELMNRAVSESEGNTALYTSMDLNGEEQKKHLAAVKARLTRSGGTPLSDHGEYRGGLKDYGDIRWYDYESIIPSELNDTYRNSSYESVQFLEEKDGKIPIIYNYHAYKDNTGRPGSIKLGFSVSPETALEIQEGLKNDPTLIDQIANGQLSALGLDDRLRGGLGAFNLDMGPLKNYSPDPDRKKIVYSYDNNGQLVRDEVMYRDKKPLEVPGQAEQMQPVEQMHAAAVETYNVEENAAANKIRQKIADMRQQGLSHLDIALSIKDEGLNLDPNSDEATAKAYDTVYLELMSEDDYDEFRNMDVTPKNYADVEAAVRQELEESLEFFSVDKDAQKLAIDVMEDEYIRIEFIIMDDSTPQDVREGAVLKWQLIGEMLEGMKEQGQENS